MSDKVPPLIAEICEAADVKIGGTRAWDFQVHNPDLFARVLFDGTLALRKTYMDGWWDCEAIDEMLARQFQPRMAVSCRKIRRALWPNDAILSGLIHGQFPRRENQTLATCIDTD